MSKNKDIQKNSPNPEINKILMVVLCIGALYGGIKLGQFGWKKLKK